MPKNHFKDVKKVADFPYVRGGRGCQPTYGKFHTFFADTLWKLPLSKYQQEWSGLQLHKQVRDHLHIMFIQRRGMGQTKYDNCIIDGGGGLKTV